MFIQIHSHTYTVHRYIRQTERLFIDYRAWYTTFTRRLVIDYRAGILRSPEQSWYTTFTRTKDKLFYSRLLEQKFPILSDLRSCNKPVVAVIYVNNPLSSLGYLCGLVTAAAPMARPARRLPEGRDSLHVCSRQELRRRRIEDAQVGFQVGL